jgi:hypothetical protein
MVCKLVEGDLQNLIVIAEPCSHSTTKCETESTEYIY